MIDDKNRLELSELIIELMEGSIADERLKILDRCLSKYPEALNFYREFMKNTAVLKNRIHISLNNSIELLNSDMWAALAECERTAPAIEIEKPIPEKVPVKMLKIEKSPRKINKFSLYSSIASIAALVFVLIYVQVAPPSASSVAMITDSVNAQWAQSKHPTDIGSTLWNNEGSRWLHKGIVKVEFDYGAEVIIEGPAEFELQTAKQMLLHSGRAYTKVPEYATGFIVDTPYSTIIDLGTEFGVSVHNDGSTDVHMLKGRASLVPGPDGQKGQSHDLTAGTATRVDISGQVTDIAFRKTAFVRDISSSNNFIWRGEDLNLADIVGGGDGFGTGVPNGGIDAVTGQRCQQLRSFVPVAGANQYTPVSDSKLIDGVFVVNNRGKEVFIDPDGHRFDPGYKTEGKYWGYITNGAFHHSQNVKRHNLVLDGQLCGTKENPAVGIHSNMGITFDLNEMRRQVPEIVINKFTAAAGVSETVAQTRPDHRGKADVWVLLDGEVKFSKRVHWQEGSCSIDVPVQPGDRFLTLAVTDAGDNDAIAHDWAMFVRPVLQLQQAD
jgi:hypothetical protein